MVSPRDNASQAIAPAPATATAHQATVETTLDMSGGLRMNGRACARCRGAIGGSTTGSEPPNRVSNYLVSKPRRVSSRQHAHQRQSNATRCTLVDFHHRRSRNPSTKPVPDVHPLAALAATGAIITPTYALKAAPELDWTARLGPTRDV